MRTLFVVLLGVLFFSCGDVTEPERQSGFDFSKISVLPEEADAFDEFRLILQRKNLQKQFRDLEMLDRISITGWDNQHTDDVRTAFLEGYYDAIYFDFRGVIKTAIVDTDPSERSGASTPYYEFLEGYDVLIHSYVSPVDWVHFNVFREGGEFNVEGIEKFLMLHAAGSNSFVQVNSFPVDELTPNHFVTGCGVDENTTGYFIEFFDKDPVYGQYSSFSNGYIGGLIVGIYNTALIFDRDLNWADVKNAVIKTSTLSQWDRFSGYGKIRVLNALWYLFKNRWRS